MCILFCAHLSAQNTKECLTDEILRAAIEKDPNVSKALEELDQNHLNYLENMARNGQRVGSVKVIPIVFHIVHKYGSENISKAQVESAVAVINEDFRKLNTDLSKIKSEFQPIIGDVGLEFRLAKIDPNGNCTEGITRIESGLTFEGKNFSVKTLDNWPRSKYVNVWVVDYIDDASGYATLPGTASATYDGIVIRHTMLGKTGTAWGKPRTLTHEIGHFLGLYHIWGNGENGDDANCNIDDRVDDTPNTVGSGIGNCNLSQSSCGSLDNVQNFMDYSLPCRYMFTEGQKDRMNAALESSSGERNTLWTQANLDATGTNDGYNGGPCAPLVDFDFNTDAICKGGVVSFEDVSYNNELDSTWKWAWTFEGGTPATSTEQNPIVTYNTSGLYDVTLTATNSNGNNTKKRNQSINVKEVGAVVAPYTEGIESLSFPANAGGADESWSIEGESTTSWQRVTTSAASGTACIRIRHRFLGAGDVNSMISPSYDMTEIASGHEIKFKLAYAKRTASDNDKLKVSISRDCGKSWLVRYTKSSSKLVSNGGALVSGNYEPATGDWKEEKISLLPFADDPHLMFKFESISGAGQSLFIDDININGEPVGINNIANEIIDFNVYPNPTDGDTRLNFFLREQGITSISISDLTGKLVGKMDLHLMMKGEHEISITSLTERLTPGAYFVALNVDDKPLKINKLIVSD